MKRCCIESSLPVGPRVVGLTILGGVAKTVGRGWRALILPGSPHSGLLRSPIPIVELISCILHGNKVRKENVLGLAGQAGQPHSEGREESPEKEGV